MTAQGRDDGGVVERRRDGVRTDGGVRVVVDRRGAGADTEGSGVGPGTQRHGGVTGGVGERHRQGVEGVRFVPATAPPALSVVRAAVIVDVAIRARSPLPGSLSPTASDAGSS